MKKLLFAKLLKDFFKIFIVVGFALVLIVWIIQAVNYLKFVTDDGHSFNIYFLYTLLNFPKIFHKMLPTIFFLTLFYQLIQYERKNELLVFWTHGLNKMSFINLMLLYSLFILIIQILLSSYIAPTSQNLARQYLKNSDVDFFPSLIREGKFINIVSNLTILIDSKTTGGLYKNIYIKESDGEEGDISNTIFAESGYLVNEGKRKFLKLNNGKFYSNTAGKYKNFNFDEIEFDLTKYASNTITDTKIQEVDSLFLIKCFYSLNKDIKYFKDNKIYLCDKNSFQGIKEEFLSRFYKPFYIPLLCLIIALLITTTKESIDYNFFKIILFFTTFVTIVISEISLKYAALNSVGMIVFIFFPLISFFSLYIFFNKKFNSNT